MNVYASLRERARQRRDDVIAKAKLEYERAMQRIRDLARDMGDMPPEIRETDLLPLRLSVMRVIPVDRSFTVRELLGWLQEEEPARTLRTVTVRVVVNHLAECGELRRVRWGDNGQMLYADKDCTEDGGRWGALNYPQAIELVLRERRQPMSCIELAIVLKDEGFRPGKTQREIYDGVNSALRNALRFQMVGRKSWDVVNAAEPDGSLVGPPGNGRRPRGG